MILSVVNGRSRGKVDLVEGEGCVGRQGGWVKLRSACGARAAYRKRLQRSV